MTLEDAQRMLTLVRQYRRSLGSLRRVRRRIVRLLDTRPYDSALRESVLDAIETRLERCCDQEREAILAAREQHSVTDAVHEPDAAD